MRTVTECRSEGSSPGISSWHERGIYLFRGRVHRPRIASVGSVSPFLSMSMRTSAMLESILAKAADAALVVDDAGSVLFANEQACGVLKYGSGELDGQKLELLVPERFRLAHIGHRLRFTDERRRRPMGTGIELFALCKDGSELLVDIALNPLQRGLQTLVVATIRVRDAGSQRASSW